MAVIHAPQAVAAAPLPAIPPAVPPGPPIALLLVEPQFLLRRTVSSVARDLRLAEPQELTSIDAAARVLETHRFDALFLSLDDEAPTLAFMERVRASETNCDAGIPIAVMAGACDTSLALKLKTLQVRRLLLRPFKVKTVLDAIVALRPEPLKAA